MLIQLEHGARCVALICALALAACGGSTSAVPPTEAAPTAVPSTPVPRGSAPPGPTPTLEALVSNTIPEDNQRFRDQLPFSTTAHDPAVGAHDGAGIAAVTFEFFGPDGSAVFSHTEMEAQYCAFGGGNAGQPCDIWRFSEHGDLWPNGQPAHSGTHRLLVTIRTTSGLEAHTERTMRLDLQ